MWSSHREGSSRRAPPVATATREALTPDPAAPPGPAPSRSRDQHGEGQPGSAAAAAAARRVLGAAGPARPSPVPATLQPAACRRWDGRVPCPPSRSTARRPAPAPAREEEPRRGGGGGGGGGRGRGLREGARPREPPAVRITGVGGRSRAGPADQRGQAGSAEEARAARPRGGRRGAGGCEFGRASSSRPGGGRPPIPAALRGALAARPHLPTGQGAARRRPGAVPAAGCA